jgi:hypothetical protein
MKPVHLNKWENAYRIERMKSVAKIAQSPDMNLTLNEIRTGERVSDKIGATLFVYTLGVFLIMLISF